MQPNLHGSKPGPFLSDALNLAQDLLDDVLLVIRTRSFSETNEALRNHHIMELTDDISRFVEITTLLSRAVGNKAHVASVKESHIRLLFVVKGITQASKKQDLAALEELIKYELKDNLTQWKIDLIPQTKRLLPS